MSLGELVIGQGCILGTVSCLPALIIIEFA